MNLATFVYHKKLKDFGYEPTYCERGLFQILMAFLRTVQILKNKVVHVLLIIFCKTTTEKIQIQEGCFEFYCTSLVYKKQFLKNCKKLYFNFFYNALKEIISSSLEVHSIFLLFFHLFVH